MNMTSITCLVAIGGLLAVSVPAASAETEGSGTVESGPQTILIPHGDLGCGDNASETVAAAARLHGIRNSFTPDKFISHILYVTGIVDRDIFPAKSWSTSLTCRLSKKGLLHRNMKPEPGDLVFFSLSSAAPHSAKASKVSIGVVEKVRKGSIEFILAGSERVIRGTLKTSKGKVSETRLVSCKSQPAKSAKAKSKKGAKAKKDKAAKSGKTTGGTSKTVPCSASELLIGFADIDDVALELNPLPPSPPGRPETETESASQTP